MSNQEIGDLDPASALAGTEIGHIVQGGESVRATAQAIANLAINLKADQPTAESGLSDEALMTPLRTSQAIAAQSGDSSQDVAMLYLLLAAMGGNRLNMKDGIVDPIRDLDDINTGISSGYTMTGSGIVVVSSAGGDLIPTMTGETTGGVTITSTHAYGGQEAWKLGTNSSSAWGSGSGGLTPIVDVDLGVAADVTAMTVKIGPSTLNSPQTMTVQSSVDFVTWDTHFTETGLSWSANEQKDFVLPAVVNARYWRLANISCSAGWEVLEELQLLAPAVLPLLDVTSVSFPADDVPGTVRAGLLIAAAVDVVIGTDVTLEVSRNGGVSWALAGLALVDTLETGAKYYEDEAVDVSGQTSGSAMVWRLKTINPKMVSNPSILMQWS